MKLEFTVENSNTMDNLIFGDLSSAYSTITYNKKNNSLIDAQMEQVINTDTLFVYFNSISRLKVQ
ncbi:hypothetical protein D3C73_1525210 [compost metagenome]